MSNIWDQTIDVNEELVRALITQVGLDVRTIELLGEGYDNVAYLVNNEWVFRFPRRELGIMCMENEIAILPYIAEQVSFQLTNPKFIGTPSDAYPYPFAGYHIVPGKTLCEAAQPLIDDLKFARTLGLWLKELHSVPIKQEHLQLIKGDNSWRLDIENRVKFITSQVVKYEQYFTAAGFPQAQLLDIINLFHKLDFKLDNPCYLHGDLYFRHIVVDENILPCGLIDWGDTHIGQPGIDLSAGIMIFNETALEEFFASYGEVGDDTRLIASFRSLCHNLGSLGYFHQKNLSAKVWVDAALHNSIAKFIKYINIKKT